MGLVPDARAYPSPAKGPDGEPLFTDVGWFGRSDAANLFVTISATHGVEGYCGSACQVDWIQNGGLDLPPHVAALVIHAINPYGFAWDRRVTEEGCDLNRNFVDFAAGVPANPGYDALADALVPGALEGPVFEQAEAKIAGYRKEHGEIAFLTARKSGQYRHPGGTFFGGFGPTAARRTLETIAADYRVEERKRVIIVDHHTGLGPFGYGELQCEQASGMDGYERARAIFGNSVTSPDLGTSSSVALNGTLDELLERLLGDRHTYVCLEFGTFEPERGRRVLRQDHWLASHRPQDMDTELGRRCRRDTRDHYFPETDDWKESIIFRARQVARQAVEALSR
ncbi:MAG: DUF2817 domain-containing protein [Alphaproteobacteria bacterium]|nr:DUF2817 domain-containing protein [Alphaproteobacteria bacterium]